MTDDDLILKLILSVIIIAFIYFILFWNFPERFILRKPLARFTRYIWWAGLNNTWSLFAPDPLSTNLMVGFELEYADGRTEAWKSDKFKLVGMHQSITSIRHFRAHRQLVAIMNKTFSKAVCRYIHREIQKETHRAEFPALIHIIRYEEPKNESIKEVLPWISNRVFSYDVGLDLEIEFSR